MINRIPMRQVVGLNFVVLAALFAYFVFVNWLDFLSGDTRVYIYFIALVVFGIVQSFVAFSNGSIKILRWVLLGLSFIGFYLILQEIQGHLTKRLTGILLYLGLSIYLFVVQGAYQRNTVFKPLPFWNEMPLSAQLGTSFLLVTIVMIVSNFTIGKGMSFEGGFVYGGITVLAAVISIGILYQKEWTRWLLIVVVLLLLIVAVFSSFYVLALSSTTNVEGITMVTFVVLIPIVLLLFITNQEFVSEFKSLSISENEDILDMNLD